MPADLFVNHTNHPSKQWVKEQRLAASRYGKIVDLPFPSIAPQATKAEVRELAADRAERILSLDPAAVLCQGEFTYTYHLTGLLLARHVLVMVATSERIATEIAVDGAIQKVSLFRFVQFRPY